ncbi:MAG: SAM-dependent methyltransferase [Deltaproteobacteria bacterium]|nr:SAM-dependent methyltransferase [Deltaproteobacteria bacterium]
MKEEKASRTAEIVTAFRAAESLRAEKDRVCYDSMAKDFLDPRFSLIGRFEFIRKAGLWYADRKSPGITGLVVLRTRYIDDYLTRCMEDGIDQLVIMGAGYDSRPYRFEGLKNKVVFEVDYPATQGKKIKKVKWICGSLPGHVVYVPIDFERETLEERLFENGYDRNMKTLFIWEGVTTYITAEAVDNTLFFVANNSGTGSTIIFSYVFQSVVDGTSGMEGAEKWRKALEKRGEPPVFGIESSKINEFLLSRGFCNVKDASMESLKKVYFTGRNRNRKASPWAGIVYAAVGPGQSV